MTAIAATAPAADRGTVIHCGDAATVLAAMPDRSVDLVFTSPPYEDARTYQDGMPGGKRFKLKGQAWVDWLAPIVADCCRVSAGLVLVNVSATVRRFRYSAAVEWLVADLTRVHGLVCGPAPYAWTKAAGIPGSGAKHYHRRDWEPVYAFALPDRLPLKWSDPLAFGRRPRVAKGGEFSNRRTDGRKVGSTYHAKRRPDGTPRSKWYTPPEIANPGNVVKGLVGGGHLGSAFAHAGEASMPESVAERFVCWYCPSGGLVLDPFAGTGTTLAVALKYGRRAMGIEVRPAMCDVARRRLRTVQTRLC